METIVDKDTKPKKDENLCKLKYNRLNKKYVWINTNKRWWNVNLILSRKISPNNGTQHYTKGGKNPWNEHDAWETDWRPETYQPESRMLTPRRKMSFTVKCAMWN